MGTGDYATADGDNSSCWASAVAFAKKELLLTLTLLGVVLGVLTGIAANAAEPSRLVVTFLGEHLTLERTPGLQPHTPSHFWPGFPGEVLMRLLQMMVLPLIAGSMIAGVCSLSSSGAKSGKLAKITLAYYMGSTVIAVILGIQQRIIARIHAPITIRIEWHEPYLACRRINPKELIIR